MRTFTLVQAGALVALMILGAYAANGATSQISRPPQCAAEMCENPVGKV